MNTIYVVGSVPYLGDLLSGFAIDKEGIRQIVINHWRDFLYTEESEIEIKINMPLMHISVIDKSDGEPYYSQGYHIHVIGRAQ